MSAPGGERTAWTRGRIAGAWAAATLAALVALQGAPGVSRDEAVVIAAAGDGGAALPHPPLGPVLARAGHAAGTAIGAPALRAYRLGSALAGALLSALLAATAFGLAGAAGALLAPALYWFAPRTLHAGLVATPDLAGATLGLAAILAWRRACRAGSTRGALPAAALGGALLGAATLARADLWCLGPALALHAALAAVLARRQAPAAAPAGAALPVLAATLGSAAVVVVAGWPAALSAGAGPWLPPAAGGPAPFASLAAVPGALGWVLAGGFAHAAVRVGAALRIRAPARAVSDDALLALAALAAVGGAALAHASAGARPWLPALPFLAVLGARAIVRAAGLAWPARPRTVVAALALLVLYPGLRLAARTYPNGAAAWGELVGGAAGAASRGLPRQDGGEAAARLLPELSARAAPGARVWWTGVAPEAVALYARDGRLRADLAVAARPQDADLAVVTLDGASRDAEYRVWSAFGTSRPCAGAYLDEVPLALVYARPGAWR